jgi:hypothetical protein
VPSVGLDEHEGKILCRVLIRILKVTSASASLPLAIFSFYLFHRDPSVMGDSFRQASVSLARLLNLKKFPDNASTIVVSFMFFTGVHLVVAPLLSSWLFPASFGQMKRRQKNQWCNPYSQARCIELKEVLTGLIA